MLSPLGRLQSVAGSEVASLFFSFEGMDGVGKTTQIERFCRYLQQQGYDTLTCRDPGSTPLGEKIRSILLDSGPDTPIGLRSEMLLYMAARAQLVDEVILPALKKKQVVISDRFLLANIVYQGYAGGLDAETIRHIGDFATAGVQPDLVFLLDLDPHAARRRLNRPLDRMEDQGESYRERLRAGYLREAEGRPEHIAVLDASRPVDAIHEEIVKLATQRMLST